MSTLKTHQFPTLVQPPTTPPAIHVTRCHSCTSRYRNDCSQRQHTAHQRIPRHQHVRPTRATSSQQHVGQPTANSVANSMEPQSPAHATSSHQHVQPTTTTTHGTPFIPPHAGRVDAVVAVATVPAAPAALPMLTVLPPALPLPLIAMPPHATPLRYTTPSHPPHPTPGPGRKIQVLQQKKKAGGSVC